VEEMRLLSDRIFKSRHVSLGPPIEVKALNHLNDDTVVALGNTENGNGYETANDEATRQVYSYIIEEANREAERIINEAKTIADSIMDEVFEKARKEKELAIEAGRKEGYESGKREAEEEYRALLEEAENIRTEAEKEYSRVLQSAEEDIVNIVIKTAKKVVGMELDTNRKIIINLVAEALAKCSNRDSFIVRVSQQDYDYVKDNQEEIKKTIEGIGFIELKEDPSLEPGSCIVETNYGCIDSGIDTRMKILEDAFHEYLNNRE
jgi:flagellar assembly protein FliH